MEQERETIPNWLEGLIQESAGQRKKKLKQGWIRMIISAVLLGAAAMGLALMKERQEMVIVGMITLSILVEGTLFFQQLLLLMKNPGKSYACAAARAGLLQEGVPEEIVCMKEEMLYLLGHYLLEKYLSPLQISRLDVTDLNSIEKLKSVRHTVDGHAPEFRLNLFNKHSQIVKTIYFRTEDELTQLLDAVGTRRPELLE